MAGKPFKIDFVSDASKFLRTGTDVERKLEDVADSLDAIADESTDAAKTLDKRFSDAFSSVRGDAKKTGKSVSDDVTDGTRRASAGMDDLKNEAHSSAREAAASFSGSAEDIGDVFQEIAANAFEGFGPAGVVAGLAAAAGIGIVTTELQAAADKAQAAKDSTIELATELADVKGDRAALDWASRLQTYLTEIVDNKQWFEFWQDQPVTRLEKWSKAAKKYGLSVSDMAQAATGDTQALTRIMSALNSEIERQDAAGRAAAKAGQAWITSTADLDALKSLRDELTKQNASVAEAADLYGQLETAMAGIQGASSATAQASADGTQAYADQVAASLDEAGQSWTDYVEGGKVNLAKYNAAIEDQAKAVRGFETNLVKASATLSVEALSYIESLGPKAAPLLQAFVDAPNDQKARTAANWDALGKAATAGYVAGLDLTNATNTAVQKATAQTQPVKVPATLDTSNLASEAYRAAAAVPTVTIRAKYGFSTPAIG